MFPVIRNDLNAYVLASLPGSSTRHQTCQFSQEETKLLLSRCRQQQTTITGALSAAILSAASEVIGITSSNPKDKVGLIIIIMTLTILFILFTNILIK